MIAQFLLLAIASSRYSFCYWKVFLNIVYKDAQGINISSPHHLSQDPFGTSRPHLNTKHGKQRYHFDTESRDQTLNRYRNGKLVCGYVVAISAFLFLLFFLCWSSDRIEETLSCATVSVAARKAVETCCVSWLQRSMGSFSIVWHGEDWRVGMVKYHMKNTMFLKVDKVTDQLV